MENTLSSQLNIDLWRKKLALFFWLDLGWRVAISVGSLGVLFGATSLLFSTAIVRLKWEAVAVLGVIWILGLVFKWLWAKLRTELAIGLSPEDLVALLEQGGNRISVRRIALYGMEENGRIGFLPVLVVCTTGAAFDELRCANWVEDLGEIEKRIAADRLKVPASAHVIGSAILGLVVGAGFALMYQKWGMLFGYVVPVTWSTYFMKVVLEMYRWGYPVETYDGEIRGVLARLSYSEMKLVRGVGRSGSLAAKEVRRWRNS